MAASGWGGLLRGGNAARSLILTLGTGLHAIEVFVATTVMPSVVAEIGGLAYYAWSTTLFVAASIVGSAVAVRVLARGPRAAYRAATALFALGTLMCAVAPSMPVLLVGRTVQGLGGGLLVAFSYALIRVLLPERLWAHATGLIAVAWGAATLLGPALGGLFAEWGAWRMAFWVVLVVAGGFAVLTELGLPAGERRPPGSITAPPVGKIVLLTLAVLSIAAGSVAVAPWLNAAGLIGAVGLFLALWRAERRAERPILPRGALGRGNPLAALYATVALLLFGISADVYLPYFLQVLHGRSPLTAGYLSALVAVGWSAAAMVSAGFSTVTARAMTVFGPGLLGVAILGLVPALTWTVPGSTTGLAATAVLLSLMGLGIGSAWPHVVAAVLDTAAEDEGERAGASITTVELLGSAVGAAAAGMVANLAGITLPGGVEGAADAAFWLLATFAVAPLAAAATAAAALRRRGSEQASAAPVPPRPKPARRMP